MMYVYVKIDTLGIVNDYEHAEISESDPTQWPMKFYDNTTNNPDLLEVDGWHKVYLIYSWYSTFKTYYRLFTLIDGSLRMPTNVPQPDNNTLMALMNAQAIETQKVINDNRELKQKINQVVDTSKGDGN